MDKWVCGRQPNSLPERQSDKSLYCLCGMQPTDISSFNNGPEERNIQKKKLNVEYLEYLKQRQKKYMLKQIKRASTANTTWQ